MKEDKRTEKQILSNIEDYTRLTMKHTDRTAKNTAFRTWLTLIGFGVSIALLALNLK